MIPVWKYVKLAPMTGVVSHVMMEDSSTNLNVSPPVQKDSSLIYLTTDVNLVILPVIPVLDLNLPNVSLVEFLNS